MKKKEVQMLEDEENINIDEKYPDIAGVDGNQNASKKSKNENND